mmetsp:Transcript_38920/g.90560  ORF Transcript_38920/g.90560 Transcript_38920/m.90560 type:complete len:255 (+) Transcript_38920:26-790(+)
MYGYVCLWNVVQPQTTIFFCRSPVFPTLSLAQFDYLNRLRLGSSTGSIHRWFKKTSQRATNHQHRRRLHGLHLGLRTQPNDFLRGLQPHPPPHGPRLRLRHAQLRLRTGQSPRPPGRSLLRRPFPLRLHHHLLHPRAVRGRKGAGGTAGGAGGRPRRAPFQFFGERGGYLSVGRLHLCFLFRGGCGNPGLYEECQAQVLVEECTMERFVWGRRWYLDEPRCWGRATVPLRQRGENNASGLDGVCIKKLNQLFLV